MLGLHVRNTPDAGDFPLHLTILRIHRNLERQTRAGVRDRGAVKRKVTTFRESREALGKHESIARERHVTSGVRHNGHGRSRCRDSATEARGRNYDSARSRNAGRNHVLVRIAREGHNVTSQHRAGAGDDRD